MPYFRKHLDLSPPENVSFLNCWVNFTTLSSPALPLFPHGQISNPIRTANVNKLRMNQPTRHGEHRLRGEKGGADCITVLPRGHTAANVRARRTGMCGLIEVREAACDARGHVCACACYLEGVAFTCPPLSHQNVNKEAKRAGFYRLMYTGKKGSFCERVMHLSDLLKVGKSVE